MRRREFIQFLGSSLAGWPLAARAQQPALPVIGFLNGSSPDVYADRLRAFRQGLSEGGYIEGQNVAIEYRWANSQYDRLPALAAELVRRQVAVIATGPLPAALAARAATTTIPIIFLFGADPVDSGLVASLNRPGGNITGVNILSAELAPKLLQLVRELVPSATIIAALINPAAPNGEIQSRNLQAAARVLGLQIIVLNANTENDIDAAFTTLVKQRAGALLVVADPVLFGRRDQLLTLAARNRIPAIYPYREFPVAGGLMSYGTSLADAYRQQGFYVGRVLKGEKPADLPVLQSTKVELTINLKTAKALGITVPLPLSGRADEIFE